MTEGEGLILSQTVEAMAREIQKVPSAASPTFAALLRRVLAISRPPTEPSKDEAWSVVPGTEVSWRPTDGGKAIEVREVRPDSEGGEVRLPAEVLVAAMLYERKKRRRAEIALADRDLRIAAISSESDVLAGWLSPAAELLSTANPLGTLVANLGGVAIPQLPVSRRVVEALARIRGVCVRTIGVLDRKTGAEARANPNETEEERFRRVASEGLTAFEKALGDLDLDDDTKGWLREAPDGE